MKDSLFSFKIRKRNAARRAFKNRAVIFCHMPCGFTAAWLAASSASIINASWHESGASPFDTGRPLPSRISHRFSIAASLSA